MDLSPSRVDPRLPPLVGIATLGSALTAYLSQLLPDTTMMALSTGALLGTVVWQHSLRFPGSSCALLPVIDCANHRGTDPTCSLDVLSVDKVFRLVSKQALKEGQEVKRRPSSPRLTGCSCAFVVDHHLLRQAP